MGFCPTCGYRLKEGDRFCENCGSQIIVPEQPVTTQVPPSAAQPGQWTQVSAPPPSPPPVSAVAPPLPPVAPKKKSHAARNAGIVILVVLILALFVGLGASNFIGNLTHSSSTTQSNISTINYTTSNFNSGGVSTTTTPVQSSSSSNNNQGSQSTCTLACNVPTDTITIQQGDYYFSAGSDCTSGCNEWLNWTSGNVYQVQGSLQGKDQFTYDWYFTGPTGDVPSCTVSTITWTWVSGTQIDYTELSMSNSPSSATIPNGGNQSFVSTFTLGYSEINGQVINSVIDLKIQGSCA